MTATACWVAAHPDGTPTLAWPTMSIPHWPDEDTALQRIAQITSTAPVAPRQLDHVCVIAVCAGCGDILEDAHFQSVEEVRIAIGECAEWNRWAIAPNGSYRCGICKFVRASERSGEVR